MSYRYYTTLDEIKRHRDIDSVNTNDDTFITWLIEWASSVVDNRTRRFFAPEIETRYPSFVAVYDPYNLRVKDLLEATSISNADSTAVGGYTLFPYDHTPASTIVLDSSTWNFPSLRSKATVAGVWGYHDDYDKAWVNKTTLNGDIDDTTTSVTVTDGSTLEVLQLIRIDDEYMHVAAISGNVLTVVRGVNGSTAASHNNTDAVSAWKVIEDLSGAVTEMVAWLYKNRDRVNEYVQFAEGGGVRIGDLAPEILHIIDGYQYCEVRHGY